MLPTIQMSADLKGDPAVRAQSFNGDDTLSKTDIVGGDGQIAVADPITRSVALMVVKGWPETIFNG